MKQELLDCKILIIEDDFIGRAMLVQVFKRHGFRFIEEAEDGVKGLEKLQECKPSLVLTDIQMPEMDGFEFCRRARNNSDPEIANVPILVQTALADKKDKAEIFSVGASDYVSKPIDQQEIIARACVHLEREIMTRQLRDFSTRVKQELEVAKSTQHVLIPSAEMISETGNRYGIRINEHLQTCSELGGDFWSFKTISNHELAIFTVDFSGHGVNAALNVFRLHALIHGSHGVAESPSAYLTHLNATLKPLLPPGQFATMFYGVINTKSNTLAYASAASPSPILFSRGGLEILDSSGLLLGAIKDATYQTREVSFRPGDCLLLYSDALIETPDEQGEMLSTEKAAELFQSAHPSGFEALLNHFNRNHSPRLSDDLTLIACKRV